jgi:hypothetical protein
MLQNSGKMTMILHQQEMGHLIGIGKILGHICKCVIELMFIMSDVIQVT